MYIYIYTSDPVVSAQCSKQPCRMANLARNQANRQWKNNGRAWLWSQVQPGEVPDAVRRKAEKRKDQRAKASAAKAAAEAAAEAQEPKSTASEPSTSSSAFPAAAPSERPAPAPVAAVAEQMARRLEDHRIAKVQRVSEAPVSEPLKEIEHIKVIHIFSVCYGNCCLPEPDMVCFAVAHFSATLRRNTMVATSRFRNDSFAITPTTS